MVSLSFRVPAATPSLNIWQRMHWAKRRKAIADWTYMVAGATPKGQAWNPIGRLRVELTRVSPGNVATGALLDRDNLWGGAKVLVDALRYRGLIPDDDESSIELVVTQKHGRPASTLVTLTELENGEGT